MPQTETTSTSTFNPDITNKAATKLCHIVKRPDFDGYGFNLHSEKAKPGQFIGKVDANSPAEAAGLKEGDRIIEVNGVLIKNEAHKQVVQRIKALSGEVSLLLVDVDGKGNGLTFNGQDSNNVPAIPEFNKTEQVFPGASENINSITMVSTKRQPPQDSQRMSTQNNRNNGMDVTDKSVTANDQQHSFMSTTIPPPPSTTMASPIKTIMNNNHMATLSTARNGSHIELATGSGNAAINDTGTIKAGSLQLPMTAAEMRAKLMMKKKYDPKNESVDLKKKYEIVQKL